MLQYNQKKEGAITMKNVQMVLVITYDRNHKEKFFVCPTMEDAKKLYPSAEKRMVTVKTAD